MLLSDEFVCACLCYAQAHFLGAKNKFGGADPHGYVAGYAYGETIYLFS